MNSNQFFLVHVNRTGWPRMSGLFELDFWRSTVKWAWIILFSNFTSNQILFHFLVPPRRCSEEWWTLPALFSWQQNMDFFFWEAPASAFRGSSLTCEAKYLSPLKVSLELVNKINLPKRTETRAAVHTKKSLLSSDKDKVVDLTFSVSC